MAPFGSLYNLPVYVDESLATMRRLSSTPGRTATRFACSTTTLFVWRSQGLLIRSERGRKGSHVFS